MSNEADKYVNKLVDIFNSYIPGNAKYHDSFERELLELLDKESKKINIEDLSETEKMYYETLLIDIEDVKKTIKDD